MSCRLICDREFPKIVTNHLWLDFNLVEALSVVNANHRTNHFWNNNHVSQMCSNSFWLLTSWCFLLGLVQLLNQSMSLTLQTTLESVFGKRKEVAC